MAFPALEALRRAIPSPSLHLFGNAAAGPLAVMAGLAEQFTSFDSPAIADLFTDCEPKPATTPGPVDIGVAWCADRHGTIERGLRVLGARQVVIAPSRPVDSRTGHVSEFLVSSLSPLGVHRDVGLPTLPIPPDVAQSADAVLLERRLLDEPFAVVHPGSGSAAKNWPADRVAELALDSRWTSGITVVLIGGPADDVPLRKLACATGDPLTVLRDLPLTTLVAILSRARYFVGNDSGPSHLAAMVGCPTVALFGPTDPAVWAPRGPRVRVIRRQPLADLEVEEVFEAIRDLLSER